MIDRPASGAGWPMLAVGLLVLVVFCTKLSYLERWLTNNDNLITLSTFFSSRGQDDYQRLARVFYQTAVDACAPGDARCVAYAGALHGDQTYARPITAFFGAGLADSRVLSSREAFLDGIATATVRLVVASALLTSVLLATFILTLPARIALMLAGGLALFGVVSFVLPEQTPLRAFQPLLGVDGWNAAGVLVLAVLAALIARTTTAAALSAQLGAVAAWSRWFWLVAGILLVLRVAVYRLPDVYFAWTLPGADVGVPILAVGAVALAVAALAIAAAVREVSLSRGAAWAVLLLAFAFVSVGENFFATAFHIAPRGNIYALAAPIVIYAALRPSGRLLWLLPVLVLFHVPIAAVLYGCLVAVELLPAVRRRRIVPALAIPAILLVPAGLYTVWSGQNFVVAPEATSTAAIIGRVDPSALLPALVVVGVVAVAGAIAWRTAGMRGDLLLRAAVLAALLAVAGQIRLALQAAGFDIMDPGAYNYILLSYYLAPAVCGAGIFLVMLAVSLRPGVATIDDGAVHGRAMSLAGAAVLALAVARGGDNLNRPVNPFAAIGRAAAMVVRPVMPPTLDPAVAAVAAPDDRYVVGPSTGHEVTMISVLKMKARATAGLLVPESAVIDVAPR